MGLAFILLLIAAILFALAAFKVNSPNVDLTSAGLFFLAVSMLVG